MKLLLAGATGLVGSHLLPLLLKDGHDLTSLGRRASGVADPALHELTVDFAQLPALPAADAAICALGTTMAVAGSEDAFRAVDQRAVLSFARAAHAAGCRQFLTVSAVGADAVSRVFYSRVKGEVEQELAAIGFHRIDIVRPGLIIGPRAERRTFEALAQKVAAQGMRNAYLLAVAPTSSTSILSGTTAGVDPLMKRFFLEEKKGGMLPRVAPELSMDTYWYYKNAHTIDQKWSVRACGVRQRHIDQAQSVNLYITNEYTLRQVLELYVLAWECGVKTVYYVRSKSLEVEECESCSS